MDILEEYQASNPLSESVLLEDIDEYEIYRYYLGFYPELRTGYNSPLRKRDESPSFSLFTNLSGICEYRWKDSGYKGGGIHGDIFKLIKLMYNLPTNIEAIKKIRQDLNNEAYNITGDRTIIKDKPVDKGPTIIKVKSKSFSEKGLEFWSNYHVSIDILNRYKVREVQWFSFNEYVIYPKTVCFAYQELDKYQIYQPYDKINKFRNNYDSKIVLGFHQLSYQQDTLIITKSKKDVICLAQMGYESVASRSESTLIPTPFLRYFDKRYKRKVVLFDNDMRHNGESYWDSKIYIPIESGCKDISDFVKKYSLDAGKKLIDSLLM